MSRSLVAALLITYAGCLSADTALCADGRVCPAGKLCTADGRCASPGQIDSCENVAELAPCSFDGLAGVCVNGLCEIDNCGNGVVETGEACDDGNRGDGDGCSRDCLSDETCGNGIVDEVAGETCDTTQFTAGDCAGASYDFGNLECRASCEVDDSGCGHFGFKAILQLSTATTQNALVWGFDDGQIVVAGVQKQAASLVYHFDGQHWKQSSLPLASAYEVWGRAANDLYVIGAPKPGTPDVHAAHYDGALWTTLSSDASLAHIWGTDDAVYATGAADLRQLQDDVFQSVVALPPSYGLWAPPQGPIFSASDDGITRYDGGTTTFPWPASVTCPNVGPTPPPASFATCGGAGHTCLSGASATELYTIGTDSPELLRFDGSSWTCLWYGDTPFVSPVDVRASGPGTAVIALSQIDLGSAAFIDGDEVRQLPWTLSSAPHQLWAGSDGRALTTTDYQLVDIGAAEWLPPALLSPEIRGIDASLDRFVAVGTGGSAYRGIDGDWSPICASGAHIVKCPSSDDLADVYAAANSHVAVGPKGIVADGSVVVPFPSTSDLNAIDGDALDNLFVAGDSGVLAHYDGDTWELLQSKTAADLHDIVFTSEAVFAVGDEGTVLRIANDSVEALPAPASDHLLSVWARSEEVFVGSVRGDLYRWNGSTFDLVASTPIASAINALAGPAADDLFVGSNSGFLYRFDGSRLSRVRTPAPGPITAMASLGLRLVVIIDGQLHELVRVRPW